MGAWLGDAGAPGRHPIQYESLPQRPVRFVVVLIDGPSTHGNGSLQETGARVEKAHIQCMAVSELIEFRKSIPDPERAIVRIPADRLNGICFSGGVPATP